MAKKDWMIIESELDDDQLNVFKATNEKSCVVSGCAGSGKSVLALIKAQRIQKEKGDNYQIIVFTKALCKYMNAGRETLGLQNNFDYYYTWRNNKYCPTADYTIVDEIQDFTKDEIQEFLNSTKKNFFFFGDTAQSIYQGLKDTIPVHAINRLFDYKNEPKNFELYRNYRLPIPVAKITQFVGIDLEPYNELKYKSRENAVPRIIKYPDLPAQIKAIAEIIRKNNLSDVAILLPHNTEVESVCIMLSDNNIDYEAKYDDKEDWRNSLDNLNFSTSNPKVMTYHSAKGLQFETVFMPNILPLSEDPERRISEQKAMYVAMTRTYRNMYIMYSNMLPHPLNKIPPSLYSTTETDNIEDI